MSQGHSETSGCKAGVCDLYRGWTLLDSGVDIILQLQQDGDDFKYLGLCLLDCCRERGIGITYWVILGRLYHSEP